MYATTEYDPDSKKFDEELGDMEEDRSVMLHLKPETLFNINCINICKVQLKDNKNTLSNRRPKYIRNYVLITNNYILFKYSYLIML